MTPDRPHIILIITDQQRYDTIAALGFPHMDTPHLDRMAQEGTVFTHCFVSAPSCAPSRASLFTGQYPHTTGIHRNADHWERAWVEDLAAGGYRCINIGKMHTWPYDTPLGFHERYVVENKDRFLEERYWFDEWDKALHARGLTKQQRVLYRQREDYERSLGAFDWELPADMHSDNFVGDLATWWLDSKPRPEQPLFLEIGFPGPHPPYDPTPEAVRPYLEKDLPIAPVSQTDLDNQPPPFKVMRRHNTEVDHDSVVHIEDPPAELRHRQRAYYLANVSMIDHQVGNILEALERNGYLDNAVVIFTSDHGDCLGDHGHSQKWTMYEQIVRVPLLIWAPGRAAAGHTVDGLCQQMDLGPAILEWAGLEPDPGMEAVSLAPALSGGPWAGRDHVYAEHGRDGILQETEFMTMVRGRRWKLVHFAGEEFGQLFDLENDPLEEHCLWHDPGAQAVKQSLLDELREWRIRSAVHAKDWFSRWR